jgi:hypothetical protein
MLDQTDGVQVHVDRGRAADALLCLRGTGEILVDVRGSDGRPRSGMIVYARGEKAIRVKHASSSTACEVSVAMLL